jgi:hypothetical protein
MSQSSIRFSDLSEFEMKAASKSISLEERVARLEMAHRYARMAVAARDTECNVVAFRPEALRYTDAVAPARNHVTGHDDVNLDQTYWTEPVGAEQHRI